MGDCSLSKINFNGAIEKGDLKFFKENLNIIFSHFGIKNCQSGLLILDLNSNGGNVEESLKIGEEVRKNNLWVIIKKDSKCLSSCVFILAGGSKRTIYGDVGIHRPFFSDLEIGISIEQIRKMREGLNEKIKSYFNYVDIPLSLLDAMQSIEPDQIKILSNAEITSFRLTGKDASQDELDTANLAKRYNLTSLEYRKRLVKVNSICSNFSTEEFPYCYDSVILNITLDEEKRRYKKFKQICKNIENIDNPCYKNIYILGN